MVSRIRRLPLIVAALLANVPEAAVARDVVIHAGHLIDGVTATLQGPSSIVIRDDRIVGVRSGFIVPAGATVVDLSGATVLPGLIDCHVHLAQDIPGPHSIVRATAQNDIDRAFFDASNARAMLLQGFTAARDLGGGDDTVSLRRAIDNGLEVGPRLWTALEPLGPTGGHGDPRTGVDRALENAAWQNGIVDSADEARLRVREHFRRGATVIKLMPSGGMSSSGDNPHAQTMTDAETAEAVRTAHGLGLKVAAHLYPAEAIRHAVAAGVDSVEHGSFADAQAFAMMKEHGTYLVPTLTVFDLAYAAARDHPEWLRPGTAQKELANDLFPKKNFANAVKAGVKIAYGTDIGEGDHAMEFDLLAANGLSTGEAILAATRGAADLLGAAQDIGSIQTGRYADIVAVEGDPLRDITLMHKIRFVMKGGVVYKSDGRAAPEPASLRGSGYE